MNTAATACPTSNLTQHQASYIPIGSGCHGNAAVVAAAAAGAGTVNPSTPTYYNVSNTNASYGIGNYNNNSSNPIASTTGSANLPASASTYSTMPYALTNAPPMMGMWNPTTNSRYYMMGMSPTGYVYPSLNTATAYLAATPVPAYTTPYGAVQQQQRGTAHGGGPNGMNQQSTQSQHQTRQNVDLIAGSGLPSNQPIFQNSILLSHQPLTSGTTHTSLGGSRCESLSDTSASVAVVAYQRKTVHKVPTTLRISLIDEYSEDCVLDCLNRPNIGVRRDPANGTLYVEFSHVRDCSDAKARLDQLGIPCETELTSEKDPTNIYITGIPDSADFDSDALRCYFKQFGTIQSTKIVERNGLERVGFVRFQKPEEATAAVKCLNLTIEGRQVTCKYANKTRGVSTIPTSTATVLDTSPATSVVTTNLLRHTTTNCIANEAAGLDFGGVMAGTASHTIPYITFVPHAGSYCPAYAGTGYSAASIGGSAANANVANTLTPQFYSSVPYWGTYNGVIPSIHGEATQ